MRRLPLEIRKAGLAQLLRVPHPGIALNTHYVGDGDIVYRQACKLGCEGHRVEAARLDVPLRPIQALAPSLARDDTFVAAAVGDVRALREHLDREAGVATRRDGPRGWDALLYLSNARLAPRASWDPLACARLLLDRGADPKTHALMHRMPYTAITGAIGVGEAGPVAAPPHPQAPALVELLLDAGADPNDEQALYNMHFLRDDGWLELLLARGLREQARLDYLLGASVKQDFANRVALLLAHDASSNGRDFYYKRTHLENALLLGHDLVAKMLVDHGASTPSLSAGSRTTAGSRDSAAN